MWLDYAEDQALQRKQILLANWTEKLDQFLAFNNRDVLQGAGHITKADADDKAKREFDKYSAKRRGLKEAEGAKMNIEYLQSMLKKDKE